MIKRFWDLPLVTAISLIASAAGPEAQTAKVSPRSAAELMDVLMWNKELVGGPFYLIDHTRRVRTDTEFRGKWLLIYFGYTYCPDICPVDLQTIGQALDQLGPEGHAVQPLFITLDPERDSPEHLAEYIASFHPRVVGLTGDAAAIERAASAYKVFYRKVQAPEYTIDHTAFIYLVNPTGKYVGFLSAGYSYRAT